ncbi:polyphenol oxidase family protein [Cellulomonas sp. ATA003]|uniref:polyphenol oxidase family protein n=1 Tax=Cellulomonas sp. ATA003 TaxID=3073064 RepID=UPI002872ED1C|nr:polyphenol oxidase family protein [Cellulomonas sp. ATA003]WNB84849.1 polyphenol oxidase family protein [Cellulomonas sp. ATA003]
MGWVTQVHGTAVLDLTGPPGPAGPLGPLGGCPDGEPSAEADAVVAGPGSGAAVVVADCVPVLLADPGTGVVAAVHAGRRGLADGVVQAAVARMVARGARAAELHAAIGPAICGRCYEVPAELRDAVADVVPHVASRTSWGTPALDLPRGAEAVLRDAGVHRVLSVGACTREDLRFFSHRRSVESGEPQGRCAGVVRSDTPHAGVSDGGGDAAGC